MIDFEVFKIDDNCDEDEKINKSINRDMRENFDDVIDRETISIHDIEFLDVVNVVTCDFIVVNKINDETIVKSIAIDVDVAENEIDEINNSIDVDVASDNANEINEINNAIVVNVA